MSKFHNDDAYLLSLKRDDSYHFSIGFDFYDLFTRREAAKAPTRMDFDVNWDDHELGYVISRSMPGEELITSPSRSRIVQDIFEEIVRPKLKKTLLSNGISMEAIADGLWY